MTCANKALAILVVAILGLWGCSNGSGGTERIKALEGKCVKLEEDYCSIAAVRDQLRQKLALVEEQQSKLLQEVEQLQAVVKERDELRQLVNTRTEERDTAHAQFEQVRKGLRSLLIQAEAAAPSPADRPVAAAVESVGPKKS